MDMVCQLISRVDAHQVATGQIFVIGSCYQMFDKGPFEFGVRVPGQFFDFRAPVFKKERTVTQGAGDCFWFQIELLLPKCLWLFLRIIHSREILALFGPGDVVHAGHIHLAQAASRDFDAESRL